VVEKELIRSVKLETWQCNRRLEDTKLDFIDIGCADMKTSVVHKSISPFFICHLPISAFSQLPHRK
jgi:superfamily I DNA and/or RNA helicase